MPELPEEIIQWAIDQEDDSLHYLGLLMAWWFSEGPASLPDGLHVRVLTYLQVCRFAADHPERRPLPRRPLTARLQQPPW